MHSAGLVLHPRRDSAAAVEAVLGWAGNRNIEILGIADEIVRLNCAAVGVRVGGQPFVSYSADAVVVATPTGSTAYSFSAGGPITSPSVEALLVTPAAPHSAYSRGVVLSVHDEVTLELLPTSGRLAVEVDGQVEGYVSPGDRLDLRARPSAARVVRLGMTTFYQRARRKLGLT